MEIIWIYFSLLAVCWCGFYFYTAKISRSLPHLPDKIQANHRRPSLSIIVTAKNEADTIEAGLTSLIEQDYPDYEIIIINDRSTDTTGEIIDRFARQHATVKPVHIDTLPEHWLGKVNALNQGVAMATGEWLLFTDADVHHHKTLWQRALDYAVTKKYDHLALIPDVPVSGILLQATMKAFSLLFFFTSRIAQIENPKSKAAMGIGAFNLVRHAAFKKTPGFEWLRMEVGDDYALGIMLKQNGFRIGFAVAFNDLKVVWYESLSGMICGLEKNIIAPGTQFSLFRLIISPFIFAGMILAPFLSLAFYQPPYMLTGLCVFLFTSLISFIIADNQYEKLSHWLLSPVGFLIICYIFARACILCLLRDGIIWRDTYYPRRLLRKYQRYKL